MYYGLHFTSDSGQVCQLTINTSNCRVFLRATVNGAWQAWRRVDVERNADGTLREKVSESTRAQQADTAGRLRVPITLTLTGQAAGAASFDGSQNVTLEVGIPSLADILARLQKLEQKKPDSSWDN